MYHLGDLVIRIKEYSQYEKDLSIGTIGIVVSQINEFNFYVFVDNNFYSWTKTYFKKL